MKTYKCGTVHTRLKSFGKHSLCSVSENMKNIYVDCCFRQTKVAKIIATVKSQLRPVVIMGLSFSNVFHGIDAEPFRHDDDDRHAL